MNKYEQEELSDEIEDLELADLSEEQIEEKWRQFSENSMNVREERKTIRYQLYKRKAQEDGKALGYMFDDGFIESYEKQLGFLGWKFFADEWDVAFNDPSTVVARAISAEDEWNEIVRAKFPQIQPGGGIVYPNRKVERAIIKETERQLNLSKSK